MNKSELVQKVVEAGIVPESDAVKLTKKMLTELLKTSAEEAKVEEVIIEEPVVEAVVEEVVEPVAEVIVEEPVFGLVSEVVVEEGVEKVVVAEPVVAAVINKKPLQKQTKFKVILKSGLPLVRIPARMYDALVKGIDHKNIKELKIIFDTYGEFIIQDADRVKRRSNVSFDDGLIKLK